VLIILVETFQLETSKVVKEEQLLNVDVMLAQSDISQLETSNADKELHPLNIPSALVVEAIPQLDTSKVTKELHPSNILKAAKFKGRLQRAVSIVVRLTQLKNISYAPSKLVISHPAT